MSDQLTGDESFLPNWIQPLFDSPWITVGALIAAATIWFYIRGKVEDQVVVTAELKLKAEGEGNQEYIITSKRVKGDLVRDRIQVRLRGPKSRLERIQNQKSLVISGTKFVRNEENLQDPQKIEITDQNLELKNRRFPFGVHMVNQPLTIKVNIQKIVEETRTILEGDLEKDRATFTSGEPAEDYSVIEIVPQVNSVTLRGPQDVIPETRVVPEQPINVSGQASNITRTVSITTTPVSPHVSLSVQRVAITVKIESQLTRKEIKKPFVIAAGPELSSHLQQRKWKFEPSDREMTITFQLPQSIQNKLTPKTVHPVLMLPPDEMQAIKDPTRPHTVSSEDFVRVILDQSIPNEDRIETTNIAPEQIKFVPVDKQQ